jgi:hypothetical protein
MDKKFCKKCNQDKDLNDFTIERSMPQGRYYWCKDCVSDRRTKRYATQKANGLPGGFENSQQRFRAVRSQARSRTRGNLQWEIEHDYWASLVIGEDRVCTYCLGPLNQTGSSLDRMDNSKDYIKGNVTPCCKSCNETKSNKFTFDEMVAMMKAVREVRDSKRLGIWAGGSFSPNIGLEYLLPTGPVASPPIILGN